METELAITNGWLDDVYNSHKSYKNWAAKLTFTPAGLKRAFLRKVEEMYSLYGVQVGDIIELASDHRYNHKRKNRSYFLIREVRTDALITTEHTTATAAYKQQLLISEVK